MSSANKSPKKVVIVGGGVAGLSAAHELGERGFEVHVYERKDIFGGKARSIEFSPTPGVTLNGEHGFRFFPGFYKHVTDTMKRIPAADGVPGHRVFDHLVQLSSLRAIGDVELDPVQGVLPLKPLWRAFADWVAFLPSFTRVTPGPDGKRVTGRDLGFFAQRIWRFWSACPERRQRDFEKIPWAEFVDAKRSQAYNKYLCVGLTRNLVACKAETASSLTVGTIGFQLLSDAVKGLFRSTGLDRVLDGPTSHVWIDPWVAHLQNELGVVFHPGQQLSSIAVSTGSSQPVVSSIEMGQTPAPRGAEAAAHAERCQRVADELAQLPAEQAHEQLAQVDPLNPETITADYFVFAIPVEQMNTYVTPQVRAAAPEWGTLPQLAKSVEWMNGVVFYLTQKNAIPTAHTDYIDSDWAITSIFQDNDIWPQWQTMRGNDPEIQQLLSVDVSNWTAPCTRGPHQGRSASQLRRVDVVEEVWAQVKAGVEGRSGYVLTDDSRKYWFIDDSIQERLNVRKALTFRRSHRNRRGRTLLTNAEPLLVNEAGTRGLRPQASGSLQNAVLASDYVLTETDLATMEGANEAARRAVNAILTKEHRTDLCQLFPLEEPLRFVRNWDRKRFQKGLGQSRLVTVGEYVMSFTAQAALLVSRVLDWCIRRVESLLGRPPRPGELPEAEPTPQAVTGTAA
jgi:15-cis-phytoene desaturase